MIPLRVLTLGGLLTACLLALTLVLGAQQPAMAQTAAQDELRGVAPESPIGGAVPGGSLGSSSDSDLWRAIRQGNQGTVSIPDAGAGVMVQSDGELWRSLRNGPLKEYSATVLGVFFALILIFFFFRGRIRIEHGWSGILIQRFNWLERFAHWMTASSFIVLALTGLNMMYGRYLLMPLIGPELFGTLTAWGKISHNFLAFPFMIGTALMFVLWVVHNIPDWTDVKWLAKAGGLLSKHSHPDAKKFNAGQKIIFWSTVLGGLSLGLSGWALLFPFEYRFFDETFLVLNRFGADLPTGLTPLQEMQLSSLWDAIVGIVLTAIIIGHIYIGSLGMQGAFAAMGSGQVDLNWAKEHHSLWVEKEASKGRIPRPTSLDDPSGSAPAE